MAEKIHYGAIAVAVIANFIFGFIWYTVLFGKAWAKEMGFNTDEKPQTGAMIKGMVIMVIGNFLMAWVLAHENAAWSYVPEIQTMSPTSNLISSAVFTWLGFYVPQDLGVVAWERKTWKLFFINTAYHLIMLFIACAILMWM